MLCLIFTVVSLPSDAVLAASCQLSSELLMHTAEHEDDRPAVHTVLKEDTLQLTDWTDDIYTTYHNFSTL